MHPGDLLVINKTKVIPARLFANKKSGGKVEVLLLKKLDDLEWEVLVGGKKVTQGVELAFSNEISGVIAKDLEGSKRIITFNIPIEDHFKKHGQMPLPPYIHERLEDP